ncbi:MAG: hypothetical protein ABR582_12865, partial [Gemmatimonadaceae bacterium]
MREILLFLANSGERTSLLQSAPTLTLRLCGSVGEFHKSITPDTKAIICELGLGALDDATVLDTIYRYGVKLVVRGQLTYATTAEISRISKKLSDIRVSLRRTASTSEILEPCRLLEEADGGPVALMIGQLESVTQLDARKFIIAALVLGRQRVGVPEYADV